jgi:hypothetical protein
VGRDSRGGPPPCKQAASELHACKQAASGLPAWEPQRASGLAPEQRAGAHPFPRRHRPPFRVPRLWPRRSASRARSGESPWLLTSSPSTLAVKGRGAASGTPLEQLAHRCGAQPRTGRAPPCKQAASGLPGLARRLPSGLPGLARVRAARGRHDRGCGMPGLARVQAGRLAGWRAACRPYKPAGGQREGRCVQAPRPAASQPRLGFGRPQRAGCLGSEAASLPVPAGLSRASRHRPPFPAPRPREQAAAVNPAPRSGCSLPRTRSGPHLPFPAPRLCPPAGRHHRRKASWCQVIPPFPGRQPQAALARAARLPQPRLVKGRERRFHPFRRLWPGRLAPRPSLLPPRSRVPPRGRSLRIPARKAQLPAWPPGRLAAASPLNRGSRS